MTRRAPPAPPQSSSGKMAVNIRGMTHSDRPAVVSLWNTAGVAMGYAPLDEKGLESVLFDHPDFSEDCGFVLTDGDKTVGFVCGCTGENMAQGATHGYIACLLLDRDYFTAENVQRLVSSAEGVFLRCGKRFSAVSYKCPVRLPWVVPGTPGHQHNIMPGVPTDTKLFEILKELGYGCIDEEAAMYLPLDSFTVPDSIARKQDRAAQEGFTIGWYEEGRYTGLEEMLDSLGHYRWITEIPRDCKAGKPVMLALYGDVVAGFTGPIYPEPNGRGYLAGLGVDPRFQGHGLGTVLFYRMCEAEREQGARYMSIFTESANHARRIYEQAGFEVRRFFAVVEKKLL